MTKAELRALATSAAATHPVRVIAPGASAGITSHEWRAMVRGSDEKVAGEYIAERRAEVAHDAAFVGDHEFAGEVAAGLWDASL